jgi:hypothetical protein
MTLAFWRDSALQLASASPVLPPAAIWTIRCPRATLPLNLFAVTI